MGIQILRVAALILVGGMLLGARYPHNLSVAGHSFRRRLCGRQWARHDCSVSVREDARSPETPHHVENKVGAVGNIATEYVARAKPAWAIDLHHRRYRAAASGHLF